MLFVSIEDFYAKAASCRVLSRPEEWEYARRMKNGDAAAREALIESYTPMVARHVKHHCGHHETLGMALYCMQALERAVDAFDFCQDSETFAHRLSWYLRNASVRYLVR